MNDEQARNWALVAHLAAFFGFVFPMFGNLIGPLLVYFTKGKESEFVRDQALESLNFQLTVTIAFFLAAMTLFIFIGLILIPLLLIANVVLVVMASIRAYGGERYRYPFCIRFID